MPSAIEEMSRQASADAPAPTPEQSPSPAPAPAAPAPSPEPAKPAPAPTPAPAPEKPATPTETPASRAAAKISKIVGDKPKVDKAKLAELTDDEAEKLIKANPGAWKVYEAKRKGWQEKEKGWTAKTSELEKRIAELLAKPNPTAADDTKLKALEERLAERENEFKSVKQKLAERDYSQSDEYKEQFVKPWQAGFAKARSFVSALQILDEDGNPTRQATPADFDKVFQAAIQQRHAVAKGLFGPDMASAIVRRAEDLDSLNERAQEAIQNHAQNFEKTARERQMAMEGETRKYQQLRDSEMKALETEFPEHFSVDHYKDQPELQAALKAGYEDYDNMRQAYAKAAPDERASSEAMARAQYAAFPLMVKRVTALTTENESLKAELEKFRGTDPGAEKPGTGAAPPADDVGGIAAMSAKFNSR